MVFSFFTVHFIHKTLQITTFWLSTKFNILQHGLYSVPLMASAQMTITPLYMIIPGEAANQASQYVMLTVYQP